MKPASAAPDQFDGRYNYRAVRTVLIHASDIMEIVIPLERLAREHAWVFDTRLPSPDPNDVVLDVAGPKFFLTGKRRLDAPDIEFFVYWHEDESDDEALDAIADQLRQTLAPFGTVTVISTARSPDPCPTARVLQTAIC